MPFDECEASLQTALQVVDVVAQIAQALVVVLMLTAVMAFLADKAAYLFTQLRVFDLVAKQPHGVDEKTFAIGEQHRHGIEKVTLKCIPTVPMTRQWAGQVKIRLSRADVQAFRGQTGHGRLRS